MVEFLFFFSIVMFVMSIVGLVKGSIKFLNVRSRKRALLLFYSSCILIIISVSLLPDPVDNQAFVIEPVQQESGKTVEENELENYIDERINNTDKDLDTEEVEATKTEVKGNLIVHFIDVGQGASQLIIGATGKTILIDAGDNHVESGIVEYLREVGIEKLDIVIGTHPHADHIGGLDAVINNFTIGEIYMPRVQANTQTFEDVLFAIQSKGLKVNTAKSGLTLDWEDDTEVKMIAPINEYSNTNDMSAVVHVTFGDVKFLFTGDVEKDSESDIAKANSEQELKADVLLVAHHGSNTSTSEELLDKVKPEYAVIQVGKDNQYGHPHQEVLMRLNEKGIKIFRNDEQGNIIFETDGKEISVNVDPWEYVEEVKESVIEPESEPVQTIENVYYKNCSEVRAAGKAPLYVGDVGYRKGLDRDGDGIACE